MKINSKIISSLEKVFLEDKMDNFKELKRISVLKGERISFQILLKLDEHSDKSLSLFYPKITGDLKDFVNIREVQLVPCNYPIKWETQNISQYLSTKPGLYPDILKNIGNSGRVFVSKMYTAALWIDVSIPKNYDVYGESELTISLSNEQCDTSSSIVIDIINAILPKQELKYTQWFYFDCISGYYDVPMFSEKFWEITENFVRIAVKNGINMLLTPLIPPELNQEEGLYRRPSQLIEVILKDGKYIFKFDRLERWLEICNRQGVEYYEIGHLASQQTGKFATQVIVNENGKDVRKFGWECSSSDKEYILFLREMLTAFLDFMRKRNEDKKCYFHFFDEPTPDFLENYLYLKNALSDILDGYVIMDALSDYEFYQRGVSEHPICVTSEIEPFIENKVPELWCYYACNQIENESNRFIAAPGWRTRSIGMQMYKYDIVGFLHWGYNYYNTRNSTDDLNPYIDTSGSFWIPSGDTFSVYPGKNGDCIESMRLLTIKDALDDICAMKLCEKFYPKETIVGEIEKILGDTLTFKRCAYDGETMLSIREKINEMIKVKL